MRKINFYTFFDILLLFFLITVPLYAVLRQPTFTSRNTIAVVEISGEPRYTIQLDKTKQVELTEWTPPVLLRVKPGKIRVAESNCPKKICVQTGFIQNEDEVIVCVPKRVLIYIKQKSDEQPSAHIKAITG